MRKAICDLAHICNNDACHHNKVHDDLGNCGTLFKGKYCPDIAKCSPIKTDEVCNTEMATLKNEEECLCN